MGNYHRVTLRESVGESVASVSPGVDVACGESPPSVSSDGSSSSISRASWPCGYCRVESTALVGDLCPCCGRNKPLPWWRMTIPAEAGARRGVRCAAGGRVRDAVSTSRPGLVRSPAPAPATSLLPCPDRSTGTRQAAG